MNKEYYAFISYSHKDEEWAKWLQHEFEHYHLPTTLNGLQNVPDNFRPIFRDIDELSGGELKPQISHALRASAYLVIICSPNSAKSPYVDEEIREFVEIGQQACADNIGNIFPFIVEGIPHSKEDPSKECFPEALRNLPSELIAGDVTKHGREHAFVKILSGTLHDSHIGFGMLWNQFERDRIEEERREREKRDRLLLLESRYLSEKALDIAPVDSHLARMLVLKALPEKLDDLEDRPYCPEAETALRTICNYRSAIFKGQEGGATSFEISSDCSKGVAVFPDGTARILDLRTGLQIGETLRMHAANTWNARFSHNGKLFATYSEAGSIMVWNAETGKQMGCPLKGDTEDVTHLTFTRDGRLLLALYSHDTFRIWTVEDGRMILDIPISANDMAIDKDDRWIAFACSSPFSVVIYDLKSLKRIHEIPHAHSESLTSVDFSPDGKRIVSAACDGKIKTWDWMNGTMAFAADVGKVHGAYAPVVNSAKYSKDGKLIVTVSRGDGIRIWNAASGEQQGNPLAGHVDFVRARFSDDGGCIISASLDGTTRIWDLNSHVPYRIVGRARSIPFESKTTYGKYTLGIDDCDVIISDSLNGQELKRFKGHANKVSAAMFNPGGTIVFSTSCDGIARLWNAKTGDQIGPALELFPVDPRRAAISPDGRLLANIVSDTVIKVWDIHRNIQLGPDLTFFDDFSEIMFLPNGRGIITETEKDYDVIFDWEPLQELIDRTRVLVNYRQFSEEEEKRYYLN